MPVNRRFVVDVESNGLLPEANKIWCASFFDLDTGMVYTKKTAYGIMGTLDQAKLIVGFNFVGFDLPLLRKCFDWRPERDPLNVEYLFDLYEASMTLNPNREHSVEAWSARLGLPPKVQIADDGWNDPGNMDLYIARCERDVRNEAEIFYALLEEMNVDKYEDLFV